MPLLGSGTKYLPLCILPLAKKETHVHTENPIDPQVIHPQSLLSAPLFK